MERQTMLICDCVRQLGKIKIIIANYIIILCVCVAIFYTFDERIQLSYNIYVTNLIFSFSFAFQMYKKRIISQCLKGFGRALNVAAFLSSRMRSSSRRLRSSSSCKWKKRKHYLFLRIQIRTKLTKLMKSIILVICKFSKFYKMQCGWVR